MITSLNLLMHDTSLTHRPTIMVLIRHVGQPFGHARVTRDQRVGYIIAYRCTILYAETISIVKEEAGSSNPKQ